MVPSCPSRALLLAPSPIVRLPSTGKGKHTKFSLDVDGVELDGILFNEIAEDSSEVLVYGRLDVNEWNGRESLQLQVMKIEKGAEVESRPAVATKGALR